MFWSAEGEIAMVDESITAEPQHEVADAGDLYRHVQRVC